MLNVIDRILKLLEYRAERIGCTKEAMALWSAIYHLDKVRDELARADRVAEEGDEWDQ